MKIEVNYNFDCSRWEFVCKLSDGSQSAVYTNIEETERLKQFVEDCFKREAGLSGPDHQTTT